MHVNEQITTIRESKNISVNKLAQLAGISQTGLREIEIGNKQPTIATLEKICAALNITIVEFFTYNVTGDIPHEYQKLLDVASNLKPHQLELLTKFLESL